MMPPLSTILKKKRAQRDAGIIPNDEKKLDLLYRKGPAASVSITNLQKASKLPRKKVESFLRNKNAPTKYRQFRRKFPRLKVISYDIDEIWSIDVAYVDKLAKYNHGVKYLLVAVGVLSRKLRVEPMRSKSAEETAKSFARMTKKKPQKVWSDMVTEFRGAFERFCQSNEIATYSTRSEAKAAFAERNIRSLKNLVYKFLENKWSYHYMNKMQSFVQAINSRVNRMTGLAPNKISKRHVPQLISLQAEQSRKLVRKPRYKIGNRVRIAKEDLPFKKGYRQSFTDEVFLVTNIATFNPPRYSLAGKNGENIQGKFYEPKLMKIR